MHNKEFYNTIKEEMQSSINLIFKFKDPEEKVKHIADLYFNMDYIEKALINYIGNERYKEIIENRKKTLDDIKALNKVVDNQDRSDEQIIQDYINKHGYDEIKVGNRTIGPGKFAWDNARAWKNMNPPYSDGYKEMVESIKNETR